MLNDLIQGLFSIFQASYPTEDRRKFIRMQNRSAVYCLSGKKVMESIVSDISPTGLRLQSVKKLRRGQVVYLIYRGVPGGKLSRLPQKTLHTVESKLPCKVIWAQKSSDAYEMGLCFEVEGIRLAQTWATPVLEKLGLSQGRFEQRRHHIRAKARLNAELKGEGDSIVGILTNVGLGGALFQSGKHLSAGQSVTLTVRPHAKLPTLRVDGLIIKHSFDVVTNSGLHSIQFKRLDQETLKLLRSYVLQILRTEGAE